MRSVRMGIWFALAALLLALGVLLSVEPVFAAEAAKSSLGLTSSAWELLKKGGYTMIPIGLCSVIGMALTIERLLALRRKKVMPEELVSASDRYWHRGDFDEAERLCGRYDVPLARVLEAGLSRRHLGISAMERAMVGSGEHQSTILRRNLRGLGVVANLAPMLGLFGTVIGMIRAFDVISRAGTGNPGLVAEGISEALLTTAAGLLVGIPSLAAYHFFRSRGDRYLFEIESIAMELLHNLAVRTSRDSFEQTAEASKVPLQKGGGASASPTPAREEV